MTPAMTAGVVSSPGAIVRHREGMADFVKLMEKVQRRTQQGPRAKKATNAPPIGLVAFDRPTSKRRKLRKGSSRRCAPPRERDCQRTKSAAHDAQLCSKTWA